MAEDFLKSSSLESNCSCGQTFYIFVGENDPLDLYTKCPKCGIKGFHLWCEKDGAGFYFPENDKNLNLIENTWKCDYGKETNPIPSKTLSTYLQGYLKEQIPSDVWKRIWG